MPFASDAELFATLRKDLYTAVVGDVLDQMGRRAHFLPPAVRPLRADMIVAGRAAPAIVGDAPGTRQDRFGKLLEALTPCVKTMSTSPMAARLPTPCGAS